MMDTSNGNIYTPKEMEALTSAANAFKDFEDASDSVFAVLKSMAEDNIEILEVDYEGFKKDRKRDTERMRAKHATRSRINPPPPPVRRQQKR